MSRPVIGITMRTIHLPPTGDGTERHVVNTGYVRHVSEAGGLPIAIAPGTAVKDLADILDGLLIPGGDDFDPAAWGESIHPEARLEDPARTATERELFAALPAEAPVLGICYGCQFINVVRGGSLHQHIPDLLGHDQHRGETVQSYEIEADSKLGRIVAGTDQTGNSSHHQAINALGQNLRIVGRHADGTIEAIEATDRPWMIGVQWHPERSDSTTTTALFRAFIEAAAAYRESRTTCGTW